MFAGNFFIRRPPRQFKFTPFYYVQQADEDSENGEAPRIRFRRIRRGTKKGHRPVMGMVVLVVFLIFCLFYLWGLVEEEKRTFRLEELKIEDVQ